MHVGERAEPDVVAVSRALLSVSDKAGVVEFARGLAELGVELISTGGTAKALRDAGLRVRSIDELTGFPEMMEGRVKTLHPKVHGGLLGVRTDAEHTRAMREHAIEPIDLVCVNLYPFAATVARADCTRAMAVENIDIGGPSMLRSAAKNHAFVAVVTEASQYAGVLAQLRERGGTTRTMRRALAAKAFAMTAQYDAAIATHFAPDAAALDGAEAVAPVLSALPARLDVALSKVSDLRHGENPQQVGALYARGDSEAANAGGPDLTRATQLHGKELSYNNLLDANAAIELSDALAAVDAAGTGLRSGPTGAGVGALGGSLAGACVIKHTNPCGASLAASAEDAVRLAIAGDPLAAYGGILAVNARIDLRTATCIASKEHFFEVVCAPGFDDDALELLRARWQNVRLLALSTWNPARVRSATQQLEVRTISGGALVQTKDVHTTPASGFVHAAGPAPTAEQVVCGAFLEVVGRALLSNAVVLGGQVQGSAGPAYTIFGAGAGQMDRVASCTLALLKAGERARGATAYSDAFFPFADGPTLLVQAGVRTIVHPGGSKRDADTFALCNERGVTCLTTGMRHFRH